MSSEEMQLTETEQLTAEASVEKTPAQLEEEALAHSINTYEQSYNVAKMGKLNLSLKALQRVFDAVISFPLDEAAINKVKKNTLEFEVFMNALACVRAKSHINYVVQQRHGEEITSKVAENAAPDVAQELKENMESINNNNEGENNNGTT